MGLIHLDAGVVIGLLDAEDAHHRAARDTLTAAQAAGDRLAMSASALAECLVGPARRGNDAIDAVHRLVDRLPISIMAVDAAIATTAARLRARHGSLRLPDALVIATAIEHKADRLITTDGRWPTSRSLHVTVTRI